MIPLPDGSSADSICLCPLSLLSYGHMFYFSLNTFKRLLFLCVFLRVSHVIGATCATD